MGIKQGKKKEKRRKKGERRRKAKNKKQKKRESERGLKRPIVAFLSSPSKDVRLWQLQIATFFFP